MLLAFDAILGHKSAHSLATGPVIADPFISPLLFTITPALSSKYRKTPSFLRYGFLCLITTAGITFFRNSGFPFLTVATIISPAPAAGSLFKRPLIPLTAIMYKFFAPVLSAQLITAPTGKPSEIWQSKILASGGGTADRTIKIWNCNLGTCLNSIDTKSQVCGLLWSKDYKELISAHGFANYELIIWKYPTMTKVAELTGHTARILNLAMSPDGSTVISAGADETLRLWKCFAIDNDKKKKETKTKGASSALHLAFSMR